MAGYADQGAERTGSIPVVRATRGLGKVVMQTLLHHARRLGCLTVLAVLAAPPLAAQSLPYESMAARIVTACRLLAANAYCFASIPIRWRNSRRSCGRRSKHAARWSRLSRTARRRISKHDSRKRTSTSGYLRPRLPRPEIRRSPCNAGSTTVLGVSCTFIGSMARVMWTGCRPAHPCF